MTPADFALVAPHLERVTLDLRHELERANEPVEYGYFFEAGLASIVAHMQGGRDIEVGIAGRDGMTGTALLLGAETTPHVTFMQVGGWGWRVPGAILRECFEQSRTLRDLLLRYVHTMLHQTACTALANGHSKLEERLARWLLMTHDRMDGAEVSLTHEFLAVMLGVRRPGVTVAIHILEGKGLIRARRGQLVILDRSGLERQANGSYGAAEAEYRRLIPT
ncbi:Crp/Fnr family transcriptional regulator [Arsenicitalea aurantiaca]|uniref:Crp/Fnr family transcriptional regulator n=2 Tax=Arsenicitalea aurantiaca TaxID=1783274 RepID=A0A433XBK1_9HYPH|nr:Crp/Fnr family transcriptional regulator [Arsenicitalea aurantiaca]